MIVCPFQRQIFYAQGPYFFKTEDYEIFRLRVIKITIKTLQPYKTKRQKTKKQEKKTKEKKTIR